MSQEIKSLVEDSNKLIAQMRDAVEAKADANVVARIEAKLAETLAEKNALEARLAAVETAQARPGFAGKTAEAVDEYRAAFTEMLRKPNDMQARARVEEMSRKSVNIATGADGGFAVPAVIAAEVARYATDIGAMRQLARVVQVSSSDYAEIVDGGNAGFEWVGDAATRNVTTQPTLVRIKPTFGEISADCPISLGALEDMAFSADAFMSESLGRRFAEAESIAFISGDGVNKPTGLLTATLGVTKSAHASTIPSADCLIDLTYSIKADYRYNASWLMASTTMAAVAKLKDTTGQYILTQSVAAGVPATMLGRPVYLDESMPVVAASAKSVAYGDFSQAYLIADRVGVSVLLDPYSLTGFLKVKARKRVGGIAKDTNAVRVLQIGV